MLRALGPPTLFVTLSADDLHWPELEMQVENISYHESCGHRNYFHGMGEDPLMVSIHFERRFRALLKHVINGSDKPLGEVLDYFVRVEFQNRGSPHYHIFFWIKDVPTKVTPENIAQIIAYINKVIKTIIPDPEEDPELHYLVQKLQTHEHTKYCQKNKPMCKFGFPKNPCEETRIHLNAYIFTQVEESSMKQREHYLQQI